MPKFTKPVPVATAPVSAEPAVDAAPKAPTLSAVLAIKDKKSLVPVRIPRFTRAGNIQFQPIRRNKSHVFMPGETYYLTPEVAADIQESIQNFEESIIRQMTSQDRVSPEVRAEMSLQDQADATRIAALGR